MIREFSKQTKRALANAIKVASVLGHEQVRPEHLLIALCELESSDAGKIIRRCASRGFDVRETAMRKIGVGAHSNLRESDFSAELSAIVQFAGICAERLGDGVIGTEQLLAALLQAENSAVLMLLYECGIREERLRRECRETPLLQRRDALPEPDRKLPFAHKNIDKYTRDLTSIARDGGFDEIIGREREIERVIAILARRKKNSACLIGEPGVGKTAVAEGIAQWIADGRVPEEMLDKRLIALDISSMVAGTKYRGDFEERFKNTLSEIAKAGDAIVFIDELHTVMGAGAAEGAIDAANILKPVLSRTEIQLIGATTEDEYAQYVEKDKAFERRLLPVRVGEPEDTAVRAILESQKTKLERHHRVVISNGAIDSAIRLSKRYIHDRFLPDKALDLLDEAAAKRRLGERPERGKIPCVDGDDVAEAVSLWTGIPLNRIEQDEMDSLLKLEDRLRATVLGQDCAVAAVAGALRRARTGLKDAVRPAGCFLFCGPTGVGKTEVCRALARELFGDEKAMIRFDMTEYVERESAARLIGAPPGYIGYQEGGQLTDAVRRRPYSVVVFDEVEKASPQVLGLLLQIMEEGALTDSRGRKAVFSNCIVVMTSNIGARSMANGNVQLGFSGASDSADMLRSLMEKELKTEFPPEFINRVDETVFFNRLGEAELCRIANLLLCRLSERLLDLQIQLVWDESVPLALCSGTDFEQYGARPLRRAITRQLENPIADLLLKRSLRSGDQLQATAAEGGIVLQPVRQNVVAAR